MKNIVITENNREIYKKFIRIKERDIVANEKCVIIPASLIFIETIPLALGLILLPYFNLLMPHMVATLMEVLVFCLMFTGIVKVNMKLSRKMGIEYMKKRYPDLDFDIDNDELKQKLVEYDKNRNKEKIISISNKKYTNSNINTLEKQKNDLIKEKKFLEEINIEYKDIDKVLKKKK